MEGDKDPQAKIQKLMSETNRELFDEKFKGVYEKLISLECSTKSGLEAMEKSSSDKFLFFEQLISSKLDRIEENTRRTNGHVADLFEADRRLKDLIISDNKQLRKEITEIEKDHELKISSLESRLKGGWGYFIRENPKLVAILIILILTLLGINLFDTPFGS